jgi:hypothetical protein
MNKGWVFLLSGIFIMAVGLAWIITGSPGPNLNLNPSGPLTPVATPSPNLTIPATETPVALVTVKLSSDEIKLHFMDLAFGSGNANLERRSTTDNNGRIIIAVTGNNNADIPVLENAAREFNSLSQTNKLSEQIKQSPSGNIAIKFIKESGMDAIVLNTTDGVINQEFRSGNITTAKITAGTIYINASLPGALRNHTILRSLYYELGITGTSQSYPDSLFYGDDNTNANLSYADQKAIEILYGPGLKRGMSLDDVKKVVYLR